MKQYVVSLFIFIFLFYTDGVKSEIAPSGSIIENKAEAIYYNDAIQDYTIKKSNSVVVTIASVLDFILTPLEINKEIYSGDKVYFHHEFMNRSNTIVNININYGNINENNKVSDLGNDDFDLLNLLAYIDINKNGIIDEGDIKLLKDSNNPSEFNVGESKSIIIVADVPNFVNFNNISRITLEGYIPLEKKLIAIDTVNILVEPELEIIGYTDKYEAKPLESYLITHETRNISETLALPTKVLVNANLESYVVVESPIPANTTFQIRENGKEDLFVYQISETERDSYITERPADLTKISKIAFLYKSIEARAIEEGSYSVKINDNASNFVKNNYKVIYTKNNIKEKEDISEDIIVKIPEIDADLVNYNDDFLGVVDIIRIGDPLNIEANVSSCNLDPALREEYDIEITTTISQDQDLTYKIRETTPNSGIFRVPNIPTVKFPENSVVFDNKFLEVTTKDRINIKLICNNSLLSSEVLVDPLGVVFDSYTNLPLSNIEIELLKVDSFGDTSKPIVYDLEGNEISNIQFTDENGLYWFPRVEEGNYKFKISEVESYIFPSKRPIEYFKNREISINGSYGKTFEIKEADLGVITIDIPLDPLFNNNLLINKVANENTVSVGDVLGYTIEITNLSNEKIEDITVMDYLPLGFEFISVEGYEYEREENKVNFKIPILLSGETKKIRYKVLIKMNALNGTAINTAVATNEIYKSNIAKAKVEVIREVIFENPLILGKVYKDCNVNNRKDPEEIGIPGVKIYLQNGSYAITDKNGNYKLYNLQAKTNVLRIDKTTLINPYDFKVIDNRNAKDPFSAFADLKYGELHRRDFRDIDCSIESLKNIENRIKNIDEIRTEVERSSERTLEFNDLNINNDLGREESEGLINEKIENINKIYSQDKDVEVKIDDEIELKSLISREDNEEEYIYKNEKEMIDNLNNKKEFKKLPTTIDFKTHMSEKGIDNELGFIDLENDDILSQNQLSIRIKGKNIGNLQLLVNNEIVKTDKIGQTVNFKQKGILAIEYIAVKLKTGINILEVRVVDSFGNIRGSEAIKVLAAGELSKIKINLPDDNKIPANSSQVFPILINLTDKNDIPVNNKFVITLDTSVGSWDVEDINENEDGIQANIENGERVFDFIPPNSPIKGEIKVTINDIEKKEEILATTYLRDLFAVGIVDGVFDFSNGDFEENIIYTGLEKEIESFEINENGTGRIALFLKGKVKGDYLLTLSYDSDKNDREKLYRDIEPEEFYPIYGDSSINGFEAQSTTKLYIKIAKGNSFIMYGDLNTRNFGNDNINLGNYNRTLTGVRQVYNNQRITLSYYIAEESFGARVREIEGSGGFGPYQFAGNEEVVINSEKVSIITRDRNTGALISEEEKKRFVDYEINGFYEGIVFREAISSFDRDFNPIFVRIEYEVETENEKYLIYGLSGKYKVNEYIKIGTNYNKSKEEKNEYSITSTYIEYDKDNLKVNLELAQSDNDEIGYAARLNAKYNNNGNLVEVRYQKQDENFENEFSSAQNIEEEATIKSRSKILKNLNLKNNIFIKKQKEFNKENRSIKTTLEHNLNDYVRLEGGIRYTETKIANFESDSKMGSGRISWQPKFLNDVNAYFEYEQDFDISEINRQEVGIEYRFKEKSNIYIQQEKLSNLSTDFELTEESSEINRTVIGTDYNLNENTDLYSEYRIDEVISEQDAEAVVGIRNTFDLNEKWKGNLALERIEAVEGESQTSTSFAGALQHTVSRDWKTIYRLQYLKNQDSAFYSGSIGYIRRLNENYSLLLKDSLAYEDKNSEWRNRFYSGIAFRDNNKNELNYLVKYENEYINGNDEKEIEQELSFQFNKSFNEKHNLSGLYAYKNVENKKQEVDYSANWISGRYMYNINEDWDTGLSTGYLFDNETSKNYMLGLEVGYLVKKNMWLSLGYNFEGLSDNKFSKESFHKKGIYLRFRLKLSEENFKWLQ